jgi:hypothetical protein
MLEEELYAAVVAEREREVKELLKSRMARLAVQATPRRQRPWLWRVEPGMEQEFSWLRAWFLSGADQGDAAGR